MIEEVSQEDLEIATTQHDVEQNLNKLLKEEWKPNKKQEAFLRIPFSVKEALYGGGAGSGKTDVLLIYGVVHKFHHNPKFKQVFMRRTHADMKKEVIQRSREIYRKLGATFNATDMIWTFPRIDQFGSGYKNDGALIILGHCENESDVHSYDSAEISIFSPDELTNSTEYIYLYITQERNRAPKGSGLPSITRAAAMPGGVGHCVPFGDILTPNGWKDIKDIQVGDSVYEVAPSGELEISVIEQKHEHDYNGSLFHAKSSKLEIICTHKHKIARKNAGRGYNNFVLTASQSLPVQANIRWRVNYTNDSEVENVQVGEISIPYKLYVDILGWFLAEGWTCAQTLSTGISQSKAYHRDTICELLIKCGFKFNVSITDFVISDKYIYQHFSKFGKCRDKYIPREILNGPFLNLLLSSMMSGDGHWEDNDRGYYYTISKQLADDFCELAMKCGYSAYITSRQRNNRVGLSYQVAIGRKDYTEIVTYGKRSNVDYINYNGKVYDIGVPKYHTFVIKQNGYTWVSGNSFVKKRFVDPFPEGSKIIVGRGGNKRIYIHATLADNADHIDPTYSQSLEGRPDAERKAKKHGDWSAYLGLVFDEFRTKKYPDEPENALHVVEPFAIPTWWPRFIIGDWGFRAMTYILFLAVSPEGRVYCYRELHWKGIRIEEWAPIVRQFIELENPRVVKFCKSVSQDRGQENTIQGQIEEALEHPIELSNNSRGSRVSGKMLLHEYMRWKPLPTLATKEMKPYSEERARWLLRNRGMHEYKNYLRLFDAPKSEDNLPRLQILCCNDDHHEYHPYCCPELINSIQACSYDKPSNNKPAEDVAEFEGDDPYDTLRYGIDTADTYLLGSSEELIKLKAESEALRRLAFTGDSTAFYRQMRTIDANNSRIDVVKKFHGR